MLNKREESFAWRTRHISSLSRLGKANRERRQPEWVVKNGLSSKSSHRALWFLPPPCLVLRPEFLSLNTLAWFLLPHLPLGLISPEGTFQDSRPLLSLFPLSVPHNGHRVELPPVQFDWSTSLLLQANEIQFSPLGPVEPNPAILSCLKSYRAKHRPISSLCATFKNMSSPSCGIWGQPGPEQLCCTMVWKTWQSSIPRRSCWGTMSWLSTSDCWSSSKLGIERTLLENPECPSHVHVWQWERYIPCLWPQSVDNSYNN